MEKKDPEDDLEELDENKMGEWPPELPPILNPIGDPYHPEGL